MDGVQTSASATVPDVRRDRHRGRALRIAGRLLICLAFGVLGYVAWLLWGTGLTTKHAQAELRQSFERLIATKPVTEAPTGDRVVTVPGDAMAILVIPRMDLDMVVVEGTDTESLKEGPGHYTDTAYPWEDRGRVGIAGHRTTYAAPFWSLDTLRPGDRVTLQTEYGIFDYRVTGSRLVAPTDVSVLDQTARPTLVLTTCSPRFSASQRLVVFATRSSG